MSHPNSVTIDALAEKVRQWVDDFPDIHLLAGEVAREILARHVDRTLDPNRVYWHRFDSAQSSARTFNGWQHDGQPVESMTLVELVVRRFDANVQDGIDDLNVMGGFYTDDSTHARFDETNEVRLLASDVQAALWDYDFSSLYQARLERFWSTQGEMFCALAKASLLVAAINANATGHLLTEDLLTIYRCTVGESTGVFDIEHLFGPQPVQPLKLMHTLEVGGISARSILRIVDDQQRQIIYCPAQSPCFFVFENPRQLYRWVGEQSATPTRRQRFMALFLRSEVQAGSRWAALENSLQGVCRQPWAATQTWVNTVDQPIRGFSWWRDIARQEMEDDAVQLLTSNSALRRQMWVGYLNAFIDVFGKAAVLAWPIALTVAGAGLANVSLHSYAAFAAQDAAKRQAAISAAILSGLEALLNLPLLQGGDDFSEFSEVVSASPELTVFNTPAPELAIYRADVSVRGQVPGTGAGRMQGVFVLYGDQTYINLGAAVYRVRYAEDLRSWTIVDPMNPYAFAGARPVHQDEAGHWVLGERLALKGGAPAQLRSAGTVVNVPMEGVVRVMSSYAVTLPRGTLLAIYDVDQACWRLNHLGLSDYVWRDRAGQWQSGSLERFLSVKAQLPPAKRVKAITLPWLPPLPQGATVVNKQIHYLWLGDRMIDLELQNTVIENTAMMPAYDSILHVDVDSEALLQQIRDAFAGKVSGLEVRKLAGTPFFEDFLKGVNAQQFRRLRNGPAKNLASASDVLRYPLVNHYGGLYLDLDDAFEQYVADIDLLARPDDVLLNDAAQLAELAFTGYNSSHFASHPGNPVLVKISEEMALRYRQNQAFYDLPRPVLASDAAVPADSPAKTALLAYEKRIFELTGPTLFNDVLRRERADYYDLAMRHPLEATLGMRSRVFEERLEALIEHYFPFMNHLEISFGNRHSWRYTR